MRLIPLLVAASFSLPALAGVIRHDTPSAQYELVAQASAFNPVGQIFATNTSGQQFGCSGTAISSYWMLTAAHCVEDASQINFQIKNSQGQTTTYAADSWLAHENFDINNLLGGWDIGLVRFNTALDVNTAQLYTGSSEVGGVGVFVGFGATGDGITGVNQNWGTKRAGFNRITFDFSTQGTGDQILWSDFDAPFAFDPSSDTFGDGYALPLEYGIAFGDSGGGMFVLDGGQYYLAGVNSFLGDYNSNSLYMDYDDGFGVTRVSRFNHWINSHTASVNEPGAGLLSLLAFAFLGFKNRRKK